MGVWQRFPPVAQGVNQLFRLANFAIPDNPFGQSDSPPAAQTPARPLPGQRHYLHPILLNMNACLPCFESHASRSPYRPSGDGYINESGLPLYYRAIV